MTNLWHDLRTALRGIVKNPGFTAVVVLALALGLGVNIAVFDAVNGILLRPLAVSEPHRLAALSMGPRDQPNVFAGMSHPDYLVVRDDPVFSGVVASNLDTFAFGSGDRQRDRNAPAEELPGEFVSGNYFEVLGVRAALGRTFSADEGSRQGAAPVILLGHALWRRRFNADPGVVGRTVHLNGHPYTVVGVLPRTFKGILGIPAADFWLPLVHRQVVYGPEDTWITDRSLKQLRVLGRLRPGVTLAQAQARLDVLAATLARDFAATNADTSIRATTEVEGRYGPVYEALARSCAMALLVAGLVLLISCANVANLLLARAQKRSRELSIRLSLGASRLRIVRQLVTESLLLALLGGALGGLLAFWFLDLIQALLPRRPFDTSLKFEPDLRTLTWALGASLAAGLAFGVLPAWRASRASAMGAMRSDLRTEGHRLRRAGLRQLLVVAQIAISIVVVASGGLFFRSLKKIEAVDPGYRIENLVSARVDEGLFTSDAAEMRRFYLELDRRLQRLPGVRSTSATLYMPLINVQGTAGPLIKDGDPPPPPNRASTSNYSVISARYFETMETPLLHGRDFAEHERQDDSTVVIVNRELARKMFGRPEDAIGRRFRIGGLENRPLQIVGVAGDGRYLHLLEEPRPWIFLPRLLPELHDSNTMRDILIRAASARDIPAIAAGLRATVAELDSRVPVSDLRTGKTHLAFSLYGAQMAAGLGLILALLALGMATMGIYSVMTYTVSHRTREIGIRMALGGQVRDVLGLVIGQSLGVILVGVATGAIGAWAVTRLLGSFLYGVSASDPATFLTAVMLLVLVALLATLIPARRATQVDPMVALRYD